MECYGDYEESWQPRKYVEEEVISLYFDAQRKRDARTASRKAHFTQATQGRATADKGGPRSRAAFRLPNLHLRSRRVWQQQDLTLRLGTPREASHKRMR